MAEDASTVDLQAWRFADCSAMQWSSERRSTQIPCVDHEVRVYLSDDKQSEPPLPSAQHLDLNRETCYLSCIDLVVRTATEESSVASWEHLGGEGSSKKHSSVIQKICIWFFGR